MAKLNRLAEGRAAVSARDVSAGTAAKEAMYTRRMPICSARHERRAAVEKSIDRRLAAIQQGGDAVTVASARCCYEWMRCGRGGWCSYAWHAPGADSS